MSQKLIFMKIQDGRQDGGHMNPHGTRFDFGTLKILELDTITITKMLVRKIYSWGAWEPYLPTRPMPWSHLCVKPPRMSNVRQI